MTGVTLLRISARLAAISSALVFAPTTLAIAPSAAAEPGSDTQGVLARGPRAPPGLGRVGDAFSGDLSTQVGGRSLTTYAVNYPASYDFLTAADGAADATNYITALSQQCPATRIVLGGYSQGAAVVDMLAGIPPLGNKIRYVGRAAPLPSSRVPSITAVAVFGNPSTKFSSPVTNSVFGGRAIDLCKDG